MIIKRSRVDKLACQRASADCSCERCVKRNKTRSVRRRKAAARKGAYGTLRVREKYDLRSGKLFAKSKAFANLTRRVVRGIESERATHVLYHVQQVALYHVCR